MAHYAKLTTENIVETVIVIDNEHEPTEDQGIEYCRSLYGQDTQWRKASYNRTIRKNFPGPGYYYDRYRDAFIPPRPYQSWIFNEQLCSWDPPTPEPKDGKLYRWDEYTASWVLMP